MNTKPTLVVMLTYDDLTVQNAAEIFEQCKDTPVQYWGFKEKPLPLPEMQALFARMKQCGRKTALEVVEYTEPECIEGARAAAACGCDLLMGTCYFDSVRDICREHGIRYMPFIGEVSGRPSLLGGSADDMLAEAKDILSRGADGIDLLGYRFTGNSDALNRHIINGVAAPVCIAGSIDSFARLDEVLDANPWSFTIGSALFDGCFGGSIPEQIEKICAYIDSKFRTGVSA